MAELRLLVESRLAAAIIGRGGLTVRRIKQESGVQQIHLSSLSAAPHRELTLTGTLQTILSAFELIARVLREELGLSGGVVETVRFLVPAADSLTGVPAIRRLREASEGAQIRVSDAPNGGKEKLLTCCGTSRQTMLAAQATAEAVARRHQARHKGFLSHWEFETCYNDHFETPAQAYADILPLLSCIALKRWAHTAVRKRKRGERASATDAALSDLVLYDPYYCKGGMRDALVGLGLTSDNCINENRDFYRSIWLCSAVLHKSAY